MQSKEALHAAIAYYGYLCNPPPSSWVARIASAFFVLALVILVPVLLVTSLDVASWLIMRTLGNINSVDPPSVLISSPGGSVSADEAHGLESPASPTPARARQPALKLTFTPLHAAPDDQLHVLDERAARSPDTYFSTPGDSNPALWGAGIFSPPISRAASPEYFKRSRAGSSAADMVSSRSRQNSTSTGSSVVDLGADMDRSSTLRRRPVVT